MIFDPNRVQVRLHPSPLLAGAMAWEAVLSVARNATADFVCQPGSGEGGLGHTLASWLVDAGPQVALQWIMGGLWKPKEVGAELSVAVLGSTPDQAQQRVLARARELAMWLDIHGDGEDWHAVGSTHEHPWQALPMWMVLEAPKFRQACAVCHTDERATERFLEVGRRTGTGLLWTLRSRPLGVEADRLRAVLSSRINEVKALATPARRAALLRDLALLARADGRIQPAERALMAEVAEGLEVCAVAVKVLRCKALTAPAA